MKYLVVGGWENERTLIRRKRQDNDMTVQYTSNVLRKDDPVQLLIEITNGMCFFFVRLHLTFATRIKSRRTFQLEHTSNICMHIAGNIRRLRVSI